MADIPTVKAVAPDTVSGSVSGGSLFHLDQLKWLMSDALKEAVGTVRTLRATAAEAATKAKQMAEDGRKSDDIKPYAQRAIDDTEAYERIYERVDKEMATVYVRLKEDSRYIADMESKGVDIQQLRANLRPYFDKQDDKELFKQQVIADIDANDPEQKAARAKEEERRAKVLNIIKYLMRKDKENTLHRVEEMKRRYQELIILAGEDYAKDYLPVVNAAIEDYEKNVKPKDEAAKTDKETSVKTEKKKLVKTKATKKKSVKKTSSSHRSSSKSEKKK